MPCPASNLRNAQYSARGMFVCFEVMATAS